MSTELSMSSAVCPYCIAEKEALNAGQGLAEAPRKRSTIVEGARDYEESLSELSDSEFRDGYRPDLLRAADGSRTTTFTLKVPKRTQDIFKDFTQYLLTTRRVDPLIFVPGGDGYSGSISLFNNRTAFTCCWISHRDGYRMTNLPDVGTVIVFQEKTSLGPQLKFSRPNPTCVTLFTPEDKVHKVCGPAILRPGNADKPVVELPVTVDHPSSMSLDDFILTLKVIRDCIPNGKKDSKTKGNASNGSSGNGGTHHEDKTSNNFGKSANLGTSPEPDTYGIMDVEPR